MQQLHGRRFITNQKLIDRLSQIKLKPTLEIKSLGEKLTVIGGQQQINVHENGFYNPKIRLGWLHSKRLVKLDENLNLEWISPYLRDHEVLLDQEITQLIALTAQR